jgi:hypothetical protein
MNTPFPAFPEEQYCLWYTVGGKMGDKNLDKWLTSSFV